MSLKLLSIDPGLNAIGFAEWNLNAKMEKPLRAGVIEVPAKMLRLDMYKEDWQLRIQHLMRVSHQLGLFSMSLKAIAIEWPEFRDGAVGHVAAKKGNLTQLAYCCGAFATAAVAVGAHVDLLPVSQWKGQLTKEVVNMRITRAIGVADQRNAGFITHAWDAVGVGLVAKGFKLNDKVFANAGQEKAKVSLFQAVKGQGAADRADRRRHLRLPSGDGSVRGDSERGRRVHVPRQPQAGAGRAGVAHREHDGGHQRNAGAAVLRVRVKLAQKDPA